MFVIMVPSVAVFTTTSACDTIDRSISMPFVYLGVAIKM